MLASRWWGRLESAVVALTLLYVLCRTLLASGESRYVGQLPAGPEGWVFTLYQSNEFDWVTAVDYELSYHGQRRAGPYFLVGSTDLALITDYQASQCGPVLYLAYTGHADSLRAGALYDTRWRPGYFDSLSFYGSFNQHRQVDSLLLQQVRHCQPALRLP